jgi:hypothetical protein
MMRLRERPGDGMTSHDLLRLLEALDSADLSVEFLLGYLEDYEQLDPPHDTENERRQASEEMRQLRRFVHELVRTKETLPDARLTEALTGLEKFSGGDDLVDSEFTRRLLTLAPRAVERWKRLEDPRLALIPEERVSAYFKEAIGCYLYGFPVAAAVLCRSVLEFALAERMGSLGGSSIRGGDPIDVAKREGILSEDLAERVVGVRSRGGAAVHREKVDDRRALAQLHDTNEVLRALYRQSRT